MYIQITLDDARALHTACCRVASDGSARIFVFGGTSGDFNLKSCISDLRVYAWGEFCSLGKTVHC